MAREISAGHAALDQIGQTAGSVAAPTYDDELARAESQGGYQKALAIKSELVQRWFG
jgi:hypothetical protein